MRTIHGQAIVTSGIDRHGESISVDELRLMFDQLPDPFIMSEEHDPSRLPTSRLYNKQFVQLDDGNWGICADIDIYDEVSFEKYGGFSIAFTRSRFTVIPHRQPEIEVRLNPRLVALEEFHDLARQSTDVLQLDVLNLFQKSLVVGVEHDVFYG
jgi:hypothetical protein